MRFAHVHFPYLGVKVLCHKSRFLHFLADVTILESLKKGGPDMLEMSETFRRRSLQSCNIADRVCICRRAGTNGNQKIGHQNDGYLHG